MYQAAPHTMPDSTMPDSSLSVSLSDEAIPPSILRAMDGAKVFLDPCLLKVPWLWRTDPIRVSAVPNLYESDELRQYGKEVRSQLWVSFLFSFPCLTL